MAVCPKCRASIEHLEYTAVTHSIGVFEVKDDFPEYGNDYIPLTEAEFIFDCPECGEELFAHANEAMEFLQQTNKSDSEETSVSSF